jgi:hypothetical protein
MNDVKPEIGGAIAKRQRIESMRTTGANVSSKSSLAICKYPFATSRALYRWNLLFPSRFVL